jgi:hypothetical protein
MRCIQTSREAVQTDATRAAGRRLRQLEQQEPRNEPGRQYARQVYTQPSDRVRLFAWPAGDRGRFGQVVQSIVRSGR